MKQMDSLFDVANLHAERLADAIEYMRPKIPLTGGMIANLSKEDLMNDASCSCRMSDSIK